MSAMASKNGNEAGHEDDPVTFFGAMKSIGWAFFGVRGRGGHERDVAQLKPVHVIAAALLGAFLFVMILILVIASVT